MSARRFAPITIRGISDHVSGGNDHDAWNVQQLGI
jgi:hypothetical protein